MVHVKRTLVVGLAGALLIGQALAGAQSSREVEAQFRAAQYKAEVQGDVAGAIADYQRIAAGADRAAAARALFEIGIAQLQFGTGNPRAALTQLIRDYADQPAVVAAARARLAAMDMRQTGALMPRRLTSGQVFVHDTSADGRVAVGLAQNGTVQDLVLQDLSSGATTVVVPGDNDPDRRASLNDPVFSADGQQVAYRLTAPNRQTQSGFLSTIHAVAARSGAASREVIGDDPDRPGPIYPLAWSVDGRALLTLTEVTRAGADLPQGSQILHWVSVTDGTSVRVVDFPAWREARALRLAPNGGLSPDGAFIAFSAVPREGADDRHLFVMDARGGNETAVVQMAGQQWDPVWTPDGGHLLFVSNRSGSRALWSVPMRGGRAAGEPVLVRREEIGRLVGMSRNGDLFYDDSFGGGQHVFVAERSSTTQARIVRAFPGEGVGWSPDGRSVAFFRRTDSSLAIVVRSLDTGAERSFTRAGIGGAQLRWVPGTSSLVVSVTAEGDGGRQGGSLYLLDTTTGEFNWLLARISGGIVRYPVTDVSRDGRTLYTLTRLTAGGPFTGVVAIDLATRVERTVVTFSGAGLNGAGAGLAVSPDGGTLVVQVAAEESDPPRTFLSRLFAVQTDGSGLRALHGPFPASTNPSIMRWTPDGQGILFFATQRNGDWRLMRISPKGGEPEFAGLESTKLDTAAPLPRLVSQSPLSLDISPDGSGIVFGANTMVTRELWTIDFVSATLGAR